MILPRGRALAHETHSVTLHLTPSRDFGVSGTAHLTDVRNGVKVELEMQGLPEAGAKLINDIHAGGTCADDRAGRTAPVTIPLNTVVAKSDGTGSATTTIKDVSLDELFDPDVVRFILLHAKTEKGQGISPGIACADLVRTSGSGDIGNADLPESGGPPRDIARYRGVHGSYSRGVHSMDRLWPL
jgi:hypothetical protein